MKHTDNLKIPLLGLHRISVDLAHVPATIDFPDIFDLQVPRAMVVESDGNAIVLRDHILMDRQNRLGIHVDPSYLETFGIIKFFAAFG